MLTKNTIESYFIAEKNEGLFLVIVSITSILIAIFGYLIYKTQAWKGASIPLLAIGFIQLMVGYSMYMKSDDNRLRMVYAYDMNPAEIKKAELPRMNIVNKNVATYKYLEIIFVVLGALLISYNQFFALPEYKQNADYSFSHGIGFALIIQAMIMLTNNFITEKRALKYTKELQIFVHAIR